MSGEVTKGPEIIGEPHLDPASALPLLEGTVVVDLTGEPATMAARMLGDLGAEVVRPVHPAGDPLASLPHRDAAWTARHARRLAVTGPDDPELDAVLARADVVLDTPHDPGAWTLDPARAPRAVWVSLTPFGLDGPRASWRGVGPRDHGRERQPLLHR